MNNKQERKHIIYRKLIRDKIPEIIKSSGKTPFIRKIEGRELRDAIGEKILEEAFELFGEWQEENKDDILKESADVLEIILAALASYGLGFEELLNEMHGTIALR